MLMFLKAIWTGLIPVGLFFVALDFRCKFDRSFRYFGIAQLLLCAMTGIDIWILPDLGDLTLALFWTRLMFIVGCQFALFYFWYMAEVTECVNRALVRALSLYAMVLSASFFTDYLLRIKDGTIVRGPGFDFLFQPFMAACLFGALRLILRRYRIVATAERRMLLYHLAGFIMLFAFGCLDVVFTYYIPRPFFVSFNTFGSLAFGFSVSLIFLERLLLLLKEKEAMNAQLRSAFKEIADTRALKIVGESAAMLNHEVKNFASIIKGNLALLNRDSPEAHGRLELARIQRAADGLEGLSRGILDMPGQLSVRHREICLRRTLEAMLQGSGPPYAAQVKLRWEGPESRLQGDTEKLESAFFNLLKNACEAGARAVQIRCVQTPRVYVISIEDDGAGCTKGQLETLGKAFFTTKRAQGGTGLGLCVARAVFENHGGSLSLYSKNEAGRDETGVLANVVLPKSIQAPAPLITANGVAIYSRTAGMQAKLAAAARNLLLIPCHVRDSGKPEPGLSAKSVLALIENAGREAEPQTLWEAFPRTVRIQPGGFATCHAQTGTVLRQGIFSETFLVDCLQ